LGPPAVAVVSISTNREDDATVLGETAFGMLVGRVGGDGSLRRVCSALERRDVIAQTENVRGW